MIIPKRFLVIITMLYIAHLVLTIICMVWLGTVQWSRAFGYVPDTAPKTVFWIVNPVFMVSLNKFYKGKLTWSTADPDFKQKQFRFPFILFGSSAISVLVIYAIFWSFVRARSQIQA